MSQRVVTMSLENSSGRTPIIHTRASLPFLQRQACLDDEFRPCEARVCFAFNLSQCLSYHDNQGRVTICRWQTPFQQEALAFVVYTIGYSSAFNPIIPTGATMIPIADVRPNTIASSFFAQYTQRVYIVKLEKRWEIKSRLNGAPVKRLRAWSDSALTRVLRTISATKLISRWITLCGCIECIEETQTDFIV